MRKTSIWGVVLTISLFLLSSVACADFFTFSWGDDQPSAPISTHGNGKQKGPPSHAPAHGYRSKHQYAYYPSASVYHDTDQGLYFYLSGSGWQVTASLPQQLRLQLGRSVSMTLDTDKPYIYNDQHRQQYPSGKANKKKSRKRNK